MNQESLESTVQTIRGVSGHAAAHGGHAQAHELPNILSLLDGKFPHSESIHFLYKWENVFFALLVGVLIAFVGIRAARKKNIIPSGIQNLCEAIVETLDGFVEGILGPYGRRHVPFIGTIFIYILLMNWLGLIPLMKSPTATWSETLAIALATMVYIQWAGIRSQGLWNYLKHLGANPTNIFGFLMLPLMLALNLLLEIGATPFSLSLRLHANISSEDRLLLTFAELVLGTKFLAFPFQIFANILAIIFSIIQAFVFMLLTTVYIALVLPHEHDHAEQETAAEPTGDAASNH